MSELISSILGLLGALFCFIAALGVLRMPDILLRMHASTKAGTLGISLLLISAAVHFGTFPVTAKVILIIIFMFIANPIAAHVLARAAYFIDIPLWKGTVIDELREHYDQKTHELGSDQNIPVKKTH